MLLGMETFKLYEGEELVRLTRKDLDLLPYRSRVYFNLRGTRTAYVKEYSLDGCEWVGVEVPAWHKTNKHRDRWASANDLLEYSDEFILEAWSPFGGPDTAITYERFVEMEKELRGEISRLSEMFTKAYSPEVMMDIRLRVERQAGMLEALESFRGRNDERINNG